MTKIFGRGRHFCPCRGRTVALKPRRNQEGARKVARHRNSLSFVMLALELAALFVRQWSTSYLVDGTAMR